MDLSYEDKQKNKIYQSEWLTDYERNTASNPKLNNSKKGFVLNCSKGSSELKHNFCNKTQLKNISINFGFPNTRNTYKYQNTFSLEEFPVFEQRNYFYYDRDFRLFKNKSVSKYGEKKDKNNKSFSHIAPDKLLSPQHKITTSIKKKKFLDDQEIEENNKNIKKDGKKEKDVYELEVVNQVLYDDEESYGKKKNSKFDKEIENEWGEIEQMIYDNERNQKDNLLNSVYVEIEKQNGDTQYKYVEISKDDKFKKKPCIKIKYTIEDKICLSDSQTPRDDQTSIYDKDTTKDSAIRSFNYKTNTNSTFNNNYSVNSIRKNENSTFKKENVSEIHLKESKSNMNLFSSSDNEKIYFSGSVPSEKRYQKYSNYKRDSNDKKGSLKPSSSSYNFEKEEEIIPYKKRRFFNEETEESETKNKNIINNDRFVQNKSIEIEHSYIKSPKSIKRIDNKNMTFKNDYDINQEKMIKREEIKGLGNRFKVKEKDVEQDRKEIIIDKNKILKEREKEKQNKIDRYKYYDEEEKKQTFKSEEKKDVKTVRDKYRKKNVKKDDNGEENELRIISIDIKKNRFGNDKYINISNLTESSTKKHEQYPPKQEKDYSHWTKPKSIDSYKAKEIREDNYLSKSQSIKDAKELVNEKNRISRRIIHKHKEDDNELKKDMTRYSLNETKTKVRRFGIGTQDDYADEKEEKLYRYKGKQTQTERDRELKVNKSDDKYRLKVSPILTQSREEIISPKNRIFQNDYDINENKEEIFKEKRYTYKTKSDIDTPLRHKYNTFENKKKEESSSEIRKWGGKKEDENTLRIERERKEREIERDRLDREKREKERKEREKLEIEKEIERM